MVKLTPADKRVLRAFSDRQAAASKKLSSDGQTLDGLWMGGSRIASWQNGKLQLHETGGKSGDIIHRALRKMVPLNDFWSPSAAPPPSKKPRPKRVKPRASVSAVRNGLVLDQNTGIWHVPWPGKSPANDRWEEVAQDMPINNDRQFDEALSVAHSGRDDWREIEIAAKEWLAFWKSQGEWEK